MFERARLCHWIWWLEGELKIQILANYRRKLKRLGCPEVELNSHTNKPADRCSPAYGVKKPRKAEVNYCSTYSSGESAETFEKVREILLLEVRKRNNENTVAALMEKTFAHRRQEVICDAPLIADLKSRGRLSSVSMR